MVPPPSEPVAVPVLAKPMEQAPSEQIVEPADHSKDPEASEQEAQEVLEDLFMVKSSVVQEQ